VGKSFKGTMVYGMGFTFDDHAADGKATSITDMRTLLEEHPHNAEVILPYVGGEEVTSEPSHGTRRFVINFGDRDEDECRRRWPSLMSIVERLVKPERMRNKRDVRRRYWWRFGETTPALFAAIEEREHVLVTVCHSPHFVIAKFNASAVFSHGLIVFPLETQAAFCGLQARPHELWARFFGCSMKDDLRYTPSDCFDTFPFPPGWEHDASLAAAGEAYYDFRADLMVRNDEGLTKTYNRFHDPYESSEDVTELRRLHTEMDEAVLRAYGWDDVPTDCDFLLDYEIDEETWGKKKKPYRYRWSDEVRDEVLARLIELNGERAAEEERAGLRGGSKKRRAGTAAARHPGQESLA
jgi:hypothetical protein